MLTRSAVSLWACLLCSVALMEVNTDGAPATDSTAFPGPAVCHSVSRQFTIHGAEHSGWLPLSGETPEAIRLDPNLLTVTCERIKHELLRELGSSEDRWIGAIGIHLYPAHGRKDTIRIASDFYPGGWLYRMELPDAVEPPRLVEAVVQVLLLEMANRTSSGRCAEVPAWLRCGLSQQIMRESLIDLVVRPPSKREGTSVDGLSAKTDRSWEAVDTSSERAQKLAAARGVKMFDSVADAAAANAAASVVMANPLAKAHEDLRSQPPLTLEQLSWPEEGVLDGPAADNYRNSAQLLVCDLARLPDGRKSLRDFMTGLSQYFNWQMAFLKAFHAQFETQRDFEKWWALRVEGFTDRDLGQTWPEQESWRKLEEIIRPRALVQAAGGNTPLRTEMSLQNVIEDVDAVTQTAILRNKVQQLMLLRTRVSQRLIPLVDDYRRALEAYFKKRQKVPVAKLATHSAAVKMEKINTETIHALDALDARFDGMHPEDEAPAGTGNATASILTNP